PPQPPPRPARLSDDEPRPVGRQHRLPPERGRPGEPAGDGGARGHDGLPAPPPRGRRRVYAGLPGPPPHERGAHRPPPGGPAEPPPGRGLRLRPTRPQRLGPASRPLDLDAEPA